MKKSIFLIFALGAVLTGCHNSDVDFPDFEYQTIYFAHQTPVRTITLGEENYADNNIDNEHAFEVKAALGGVNVNRADHSAKFVIDDSLCEGLAFTDGSDVKALPASYYSIATDNIVIKKGDVIGGFRVQLNDEFFADPASINTTYVLPVRLTSSNDSILSGKAKDGIVNPNRLNADDWATLPQDYVLYAVKYKNKFHGCWLSQGVDKVDKDGEVTTNDRKVDYWEKASLRYLRTQSLTRSVYSQAFDVSIINQRGAKDELHLVCDIILDVDANGNITLSTDSPNCSVSGTGSWVEKGAKKAWGDKDRDYIKLNYTYRINYVSHIPMNKKSYIEVTCEEELVLRDRENKFEEFSYILK